MCTTLAPVRTSAELEDKNEESEVVMNGKIIETERETGTLSVANDSEGKHSEEGNEDSETEGAKLKDEGTEGTNIQ